MLPLNKVSSLALFTVSFLALVVNGRPQFNLGGVLIQDGTGRSFSIRPGLLERHGKEIRVSLERHDLAGLLQTFLGRDSTSTTQDASEFGIHENNSSIQPIPVVGQGTDPVDGVTSTRSAKCANDELMYEPDGKCYTKGVVTFGIDSPCIDEFYQFQERDDKPGYGDCYCVRFRGSTTRPVVQWKESNRCYWLYDQGPCEPGHWLVPGGERGLMCTQRTCPENPEEEKISAFPKFWFEHQGKCYKTETANPEFCGGDEKLKIYFSNEKPEPVCLERRPSPTVRGLAGDRNFLACKAGHKQLPNGECKRKASFE